MSPSLNILVIEDQEVLREAMLEILREAGHRATGVSCAEDVDDLQDALLPELYVVDLNLPGEDGVSLVQRIRRVNAKVGVIVVTSRNLVEDRVVGYGSGADIYLSKPVEPEELIASVTSLSRRLKHLGSHSVHLLVVDARQLLLVGGGVTVGLTQSETRLLSALAMAPENTLERWQVAINLGMNEEHISQSGMEVRVANLRKKLIACGAQANPIKAVRSIGYKLCQPISLA